MPCADVRILRGVFRVLDVAQGCEGQPEHDVLRPANDLAERGVLLVQRRGRVARFLSESRKGERVSHLSDMAATVGGRRKKKGLRRPNATIVDKKSGRISLVTWPGRPQ